MAPCEARDVTARGTLLSRVCWVFGDMFARRLGCRFTIFRHTAIMRSHALTSYLSSVSRRSISSFLSRCLAAAAPRLHSDDYRSLPEMGIFAFREPVAGIIHIGITDGIDGLHSLCLQDYTYRFLGIDLASAGFDDDDGIRPGAARLPSSPPRFDAASFEALDGGIYIFKTIFISSGSLGAARADTAFTAGTVAQAAASRVFRCLMPLRCALLGRRREFPRLRCFFHACRFSPSIDYHDSRICLLPASSIFAASSVFKHFR